MPNRQAFHSMLHRTESDLITSFAKFSLSCLTTSKVTQFPCIEFIIVPDSSTIWDSDVSLNQWTSYLIFNAVGHLKFDHILKPCLSQMAVGVWDLLSFGTVSSCPFFAKLLWRTDRKTHLQRHLRQTDVAVNILPHSMPLVDFMLMSRLDVDGNMYPAFSNLQHQQSTAWHPKKACLWIEIPSLKATQP